MKNLKTLCIASCVALSNMVSATSITLTASRDAAIGYHDGANTANNNYGTAIHNSAFWVPSAFGWGVNANRALIDFNLSAIPPGATIISAKLNLYALGASGTLPGHTGPNNSGLLQRITGTWAENTVTWNTQPGVTGANAVTLPGTANPTLDYLNINVISLVQDMINNPGSSFGFALKLVNESVTNALLFGSKDHPNPNLCPTLEIEYVCYGYADLIADYDAPIGYHDGANTANTNYGTDPQNAGYAVPSVAAPTGLNVNRALLHFNLSSLPASAVVSSALLDLYAFGPVGPFPGHMQSVPAGNDAFIERVVGPWAENTVTWNNQPPTSVGPGDQIIVPGTTNPTLDYLSFPVTSVIQNIVSSGVNDGFMLRLQNENATNILIFCSEDHKDVNRHPRLKIRYSYDCRDDGTGGGHDPKDPRGKTTGLAKNTNSSSIFKVFPNPSNGSFAVNYSMKDKTNCKLIVEDLQGRVVADYQLDPQADSMNVTSLNVSNGIYLCKLVADGETCNIQKIVVSK